MSRPSLNTNIASTSPHCSSEDEERNLPTIDNGKPILVGALLRKISKAQDGLASLRAYYLEQNVALNIASDEIRVFTHNVVKYCDEASRLISIGGKSLAKCFEAFDVYVDQNIADKEINYYSPAELSTLTAEETKTQFDSDIFKVKFDLLAQKKSEIETRFGLIKPTPAAYVRATNVNTLVVRAPSTDMRQ